MYDHASTAIGDRPAGAIGRGWPLDGGPLAHLLLPGGRPRWAKGEPLYQSGDRASSVYKITRGIVAVHRTLHDGRQQIVALQAAGELCGYLTHDGDHCFGADAVTDVEACAFDRRAFDSAAARDPRFAMALVEALADRLKRSAEAMAAIGRLRATERVAYFLLELARLNRQRIDLAPRLVLHLSRQQIADHLGLTVETVSRSCRALREQKVIALDGRDAVMILDGERLTRLAMLKAMEPQAVRSIPGPLRRSRQA